MNAANRAAERRHSERRRSRRPVAPDESFFGAVGTDRDPPFHDDELNDLEPATSMPGEDAAQSDTGSQGLDTHLGDSRFMAGRPRRGSDPDPTAFERIYRAFVAARAALGLALVVALAVGRMFSLRPTLPVVAISLAYGAMAIGLWLLPRYRSAATPRAMAHLRSPQWLATIGVDLVCFMALHVLAPGASLNYVALLVLPVLMAGVLTPRTMALATASAATLGLLGAAWLSVAGGAEGTVQMTQAGLAGTGFFVITVLAGELAGRLAREELTARGSLEMARQQAQLNRLVIEEMQDGVLVVDRRGRVRAANPAARRLLAPSGMSRPAPFQLRGVQAWDALVKSVERAFGEACGPRPGATWCCSSKPARRARSASSARCARGCASREGVSMNASRRRSRSSAFCSSRTFATCRPAAGRRSSRRWAASRPASRTRSATRWPRSRKPTRCSPKTPLTRAASADAHGERQRRAPEAHRRRRDGGGPRRGARCRRDRCDRAGRLGVQRVGARDRRGAGGAQRAAGSAARRTAGACFSMPSTCAACSSTCSTTRIATRAAPRGDPVAARFAPRGAGLPQPGQRRRADHAGRGALPVRAVFSTRSRGTGLGLYICRELCERYGATIDYRLRAEGLAQRNEFFVDMQRRALGHSDGRLHLTS